MTTFPAPICLGCIRYRQASPGFICGAYPDGIPEAILQSRVDHRYPYAGDQGWQFVFRDVQAQEYADQRFGPLTEDIIDHYGEAGRALYAKMVQTLLDCGDTEDVARRTALDTWPLMVAGARLQSVE